MASNVRISYNNILELDFGAGVVAQVDLSKVKMTDAQRGILEKLLKAKPGFTLEECTGDVCPASAHLSKEEFSQIRGLKATLGNDIKMAGLICDFCLKCVAV